MWYHQPREIIHTTHFPGLRSFRRNLRTLIELARLDGTAVILMTQPYLVKDLMTPAEEAALYMLHNEAIGPREQWSLSTVKAGMEQYCEVTRELAREEHLVLIDLEPVVPKDLDHFSDDVHYKDISFDLIADYIAGEMKKTRGMWPERSPDAGAGG